MSSSLIAILIALYAGMYIVTYAYCYYNDFKTSGSNDMAKNNMGFHSFASLLWPMYWAATILFNFFNIVSFLFNGFHTTIHKIVDKALEK